jgi:hypothetical protein
LDDAFRDVAVSSSGQYVIITRNEYSMMSKDYGVTFTTIPGFATNLVLRNNAISSSGQIIVLSYLSGVYVSTNFGISWKQTVLSFQNTHLSMSSTGQYIIVVGSISARIYISSDYGETFVQNTVLNALGISPLYSFVSANGQYQIISHGTGMVSSVDYGKTWVSNTNYVYKGIAMTSNGRIVVGATASGVVMSTNYSTEFADRFKYDVSLNARLSVALDSSFNGNLFVGGSIVNTGLTSALALKAPIASPSFTGAVISAGDVSLNAGLSVASDSSFNNKVFVKYLTNSFIVSTGVSPGLTVTFPISRSYLLTDAAATNVIITLPTLPTSTETYIVTFKRTVYNVEGTMTFNTGGASANTQLIYPSQTSLSNGSAHTQISGNSYTYNNTNGGSHPYNAITLMGVNNGTVVGWFEI